LNQAARLLIGERQCTTLSQRYAFFLFTWAPYRNLTTNSSSETISVPLPDGVDGHWRLDLDAVLDGTQISGTASVTLAGSNVLQFQVSGTNTTATKSVMKLQSASSVSFLDVVTLGPEMALQSIHGNVAGQSVDYDAPAGTSFLSLQVIGNGTVRSLPNAQALVIGKDYTLVATPQPGNLFSNWIVSGMVATNPTLHFTMCSNLAITANFVTNFFVPASGVYGGLFCETNGVCWQSAGLFNLKLAPSGVFSGRISLAGRAYSFSGRFDIYRQSRIVVQRGRQTPLTISLHLNSAENEVLGTVEDGSWLAELAAPHAYSSSSGVAFDYWPIQTLVIPGGDSGLDSLGDGYATLWIDFYGTIRMWGKLADGTAFTCSTKILQNGQWPLYVPLYRNKGLMLGWMTFSNQPASGPGGDLIWFKPANSTGKFYPAGFTNQTSAVGSPFHTPDWVRGFGKQSFTNGVLVLTGGNLPVAMTNVLDGATASSANGIFLKWDPISGAVSGSFIHPATGRGISLNGVWLQNENVVRGFFLGTNQSGLFLLQP
jgi:hypothetical protein